MNLYILAAMRPHFADEWQRLTRVYADKDDEELLELSSGFAGLTETAQQVLRDELRKRRLPEPAAAQPKPAPNQRPMFGGWSPVSRAPSLQVPDARDAEENALPREYTWKTLLCECRDKEHAWQISEVLKLAGIESWTEGPSGDLDLTGPRVLVAADQLDEARAIAERPIPQDIIDQSRVKEDDFKPPACPRCGDSDPLLLAVDPSNTWRCDVCGNQWTESVAFTGAESNPAR